MESRGSRIAVVSPAPPGADTGNRVTAARWAERLRELGADARVLRDWDGGADDALIALHAVKSLASIERWLAERRGSPLVVALSGTDVYGALGADTRALAGLCAAKRIVALQARAADELPAELRARARVIEQSASVPPAPDRPPRAPGEPLEALTLAHLRGVKDPLLPARAATRLDAASRVRVTLIGSALEEPLAVQAREEAARNPRFTWTGALPHGEALARLTAADVLVVPSRAEGGANVVGEAAVAGVPLLATRIPGTTGLVGDNHPGLFEVGDVTGLARLFARLETDAQFAAELRARAHALAPRFAPERERDAWAALLDEL